MVICFQKKAFRLKKDGTEIIYRTVNFKKMKNIICKPMKKILD